MAPQWRRSDGYAMAALLVGMSIMAILMAAALPVWNKQAQREQEEEYLFRAHQYARAVTKFLSASPTPTRRTSMSWWNSGSSGRNTRTRLPARTSSLSIRRRPPESSRAALVRRRPARSRRSAGRRRPRTGGSSMGGAGGMSPFGSGGTSTAGKGGTSTSGMGGTSTGGTGGTSTAGTGGTPSGSVAALRCPAPASSAWSRRARPRRIKIYNGRTRYDQWAVTYQDVKPGKGLPPDSSRRSTCRRPRPRRRARPRAALRRAIHSGSAGQQPAGWIPARPAAGRARWQPGRPEPVRHARWSESVWRWWLRPTRASATARRQGTAVQPRLSAAARVRRRRLTVRASAKEELGARRVSPRPDSARFTNHRRRSDVGVQPASLPRPRRERRRAALGCRRRRAVGCTRLVSRTT